MEEIVLYTTHCPMCSLIERKLKEKNIVYKEETNINEIMKLGFQHVPLLKFKNKIYENTKDILNIINNM